MSCRRLGTAPDRMGFIATRDSARVSATPIPETWVFPGRGFAGGLCTPHASPESTRAHRRTPAKRRNMLGRDHLFRDFPQGTACPPCRQGNSGEKRWIQGRLTNVICETHGGGGCATEGYFSRPRSRVNFPSHGSGQVLRKGMHLGRGKKRDNRTVLVRPWLVPGAGECPLRGIPDLADSRWRM